MIFLMRKHVEPMNSKQMKAVKYEMKIVKGLSCRYLFLLGSYLMKGRYRGASSPSLPSVLGTFLAGSHGKAGEILTSTSIT